MGTGGLYSFSAAGHRGDDGCPVARFNVDVERPGGRLVLQGACLPDTGWWVEDQAEIDAFFEREMPCRGWRRDPSLQGRRVRGLSVPQSAVGGAPGGRAGLPCGPRFVAARRSAGCLLYTSPSPRDS